MLKPTLTTKPKSEKEIKREWYLFDAKDKVLGRIASQIALVLQGKHKPDYVPYLDSGDYVVVINAKKVKVTGKKLWQKNYQRFSGYPGGLKEISLKELLKKKPEAVIRHAVSLMLPKNKLRDRRLRRLFIYSSEVHPYQDRIKLVFS
jgi:large subunit ribosomal protein L13